VTISSKRQVRSSGKTDDVNHADDLFDVARLRTRAYTTILDTLDRFEKGDPAHPQARRNAKVKRFCLRSDCICCRVSGLLPLRKLVNEYSLLIRVGSMTVNAGADGIVALLLDLPSPDPYPPTMKFYQGSVPAIWRGHNS